MKNSNILWVLCLLSIYGLVLPGRALAYLDPGSGSYLFQILIAGLIGGLFAVKLFWGQIRIFLSRLFGKKGEEKPGEKDDEENRQPE